MAPYAFYRYIPRLNPHTSVSACLGISRRASARPQKVAARTNMAISLVIYLYHSGNAEPARKPMTNRIPAVDLNNLPSRSLIDAAARENMYKILSEAPWIADLANLAAELNDQPGSLKAKYIRLRKLADSAGAVVAKHAACSKGCSQCCHISVAINQVEADIISQVTGIKYRSQDPRAAESDLATKYFGEPCPFLKAHKCSIYADRPIACRLHFAISNTSIMCDTKLPPELSAVGNMDFRAFWFEYMSVLHVSNLADIRDFFGAGK